MINLHGFSNLLLEGTILTIKLSIIATSFGLMFGFLGALCKLSHHKILNYIGNFYTTVVRGIPELIWVLLFFYGGSVILNAISDKFNLATIEINPFIAGTFALALCFGSYATEVLRGAILSIHPGQKEAGLSLGLNSLTIFIRITMPQIWRVALPGLGNLFMTLIKDTSLVSVIGLHELMKNTQSAVNATKEPFTFYFTVAMIYLILTGLSAFLLHIWQQKSSKWVH